MHRVKRLFKKLGAGVALFSLGLSAAVAANPGGPSVRHGQVNIQGGTHAQIQQLTERAIVDWQSFSIGANESVSFFQPGQLSVILNRVVGEDASSILGRLNSNGNVFLINPNGILFGPDSVINVGGLVASSLNITDQDFISGNYRFFAENGRELGAVVNQGNIRVTDGGYAVLTGPAVFNEGTIVARQGRVSLAAGERITLNLDGRDLIHFALDSRNGPTGTVLLAPGMMSEAIAQTLGVSSDQRANLLLRTTEGSFRLASGTVLQQGTITDGGFPSQGGLLEFSPQQESQGGLLEFGAEQDKQDVSLIQPSPVIINDNSPPPAETPTESLDGNVIIVEVVLFPAEPLVKGPEFAQDNVNMVEDSLGIPNSIFDESPDPAPLEWYDDDDFLREKHR